MHQKIIKPRAKRRGCLVIPFLKNFLLSILIACPSSVSFLANDAKAQSASWAMANIGTSGTGTFSNSPPTSFTLNAAGNGLAGSSDSISFVNRKTSGNVEMITKISSIQSGTPDYAAVGLTIRNDDSSPGAIHASVVLTPKNGINFLSRLTTGGTTTQTLGPTIDTTNPANMPWLRIVKSASTVAGYYSLDGCNWTLVGQTQLALSATFNIGIVGASLLDPSLKTFSLTNTVYMRDVPQRNADMALWLRADSGVTKNGTSSVASWQDQSNSAYVASQPTAANQPVIAPGAINGQPAVDFTGSSKFMQLPAGFSNFDRGATIFAVIKPPPSTALNNARIFDFAENGSNGALRLYQPTKDGLSLFVDEGGEITSNSDMAGGTFKLAEVTHDGDKTAQIFINGVLKVTNTAMTPIPNVEREENYIGKANNNAAYFQGQIAELIVFSKAMSETERKSVESYLFYKFGLGSAPSVAPPSITATVDASPEQVYNPATGVYASAIHVSMSADPLTQIYYATGGSNPVVGVNPYSAPIAVPSTTTIKAIAVEGANQSSIATVNVQIDSNSSNVSRAGLNLWLKSDFGVELNGSAVSRWTDVSGNHLDAVATNSGWTVNKPTYVSSDPNINNAPAISFINDEFRQQWFDLPNGFNTFPTGASVFIVANPSTSAGTSANLLDLGTESTSEEIQLYMRNNSGNNCNLNYRVFNGAQTNLDLPAKSADYQLFEIIQSGSSVSTFNNGVLKSSTTGFNLLPSVSRLNNYIGKAIASARIAEIIVYSRPLIPAERLGIEAYMHSKYNLGDSPQLVAPIFTPQSEVVCEPTKSITLEGSNGASVYYTQGTPSSPPPDPTSSSTLYSGPFDITSSQVIKAKAIKSGYVDSEVSSATYLFDSATCALRNDALVTWLRSDIGVTYDGSNGVSAWADQSGKGANATTSGSKPSRIANGINGYPSIAFGANQPLNLPALNEYANFSQGMTTFVVAKQLGSAAGAFVGLSNASNADGVLFGPSSATNLQLSVYTGTVPTTLPSSNSLDGSFHVYEAVHNGSTAAALFKDGTLLNQTSSMVPITNTARLANTVGNGGANFQVQIAEILIYRKELAPDERREIEDYLLSRYGTAVASPVISPSGGALPLGYPITMTTKDPGAEIFYGTNGGAMTTRYNPLSPPSMTADLTSIQAKSVLSWGTSLPTTAEFQYDPNTANLPRKDLSLWLRADIGITKDNTTNKVSQWKDISGSNQHATQATSANQPVFAASSVNGLPSLTFSGSQWMQFVQSGFKDFTNGMTVFIVSKTPSSITANARFFDFSQSSSSTNNNIVLSQPNSTSSQFWVYDGSTVSSVTAGSSIVANQFQLIEVNHTGRKAATILQNGKSRQIAAINNPQNVSRTVNYLGRAFNGTPLFQGSIAEVILFQRSLLPDERRNVEAYLVGRFGLASGKPIQPTISPYDGVYTGLPATDNKSISILAYPGVTKIRYTTDGTDPTLSSDEYTGPFAVGRSTVVKAIAVQGTTTPVVSDVATRYIDMSPSAAEVPRTGLSLWYKSDFGVTTDGTKVSSWTDLSTTGAEVNASQSEVTNQPQYSYDFDFPRITTDATPRYFSIAPGLSDFANGLTFYAVTRPLSLTTGTDQWIFAGSSGETTDNIEVRDDAGAERARLRVGANANAVAGSGNSLLANKFQVLECVQTGAGAVGNIFVDGVQVGTHAVTPATNITRLLNRLGANPSSNADNYIGDYAEMLLYNRPLSETERQSVQKYLRTNYQIPSLQNTASPVFQTAAGTYSDPLDVALTGPTGAKIFFTTDGTNPTTSSTVYSKPIRVALTTTVKASAYQNGIMSAVNSKTFTIDADRWPPPATGIRQEQIQLQAPTISIPQ